MDDPRVGTRIDWSKWEVATQPLDQLVRYLVAPPLTAVDPRLGKTLPAFRLPACESGQLVGTQALLRAWARSKC